MFEVGDKAIYIECGMRQDVVILEVNRNSDNHRGVPEVLYLIRFNNGYTKYTEEQHLKSYAEDHQVNTLHGWLS